MSFIFGEKYVDYLKRRYKVLQNSHLFQRMEFSDDHQKLKKLVPLMMQERMVTDNLGATKMNLETAVDFEKIESDGKGNWNMEMDDRKNLHKQTINAKFVFIGAGGYALPLLESSGMEESVGFDGFSVSGQRPPELVEKHQAKIYAQATVGVAPMSVPPLDLRVIDGKKALLFGPFARFSIKFLKEGSYLDLSERVNFKNIRSLFGVWWHNIPLTRYLIQQVTISKSLL